MKLARSATFSIRSASSPLPSLRSLFSSSYWWSKWSSMARLLAEPTMMTSVMPAATASSTTYWMMGLSMMGSISLGMALVMGKKRVPMPAAAITALVTFFDIMVSYGADYN